MNGKFYSLPFHAEKWSDEARRQVSLETSVRQHLQLILSTMPLRFRFSPRYGSVMSKHHFRLPDRRKGEKKLEDEIKDTVRTNLLFLIENYEPRLKATDVVIVVTFPQPESLKPGEKGGRIALDIRITGQMPDQKKFEYQQLLPLK